MYVTLIRATSNIFLRDVVKYKLVIFGAFTIYKLSQHFNP